MIILNVFCSRILNIQPQVTDSQLVPRMPQGTGVQWSCQMMDQEMELWSELSLQCGVEHAMHYRKEGIRNIE